MSEAARQAENCALFGHIGRPGTECTRCHVTVPGVNVIITEQEVQLLLVAIIPELRCIRDCRFTSTGSTMIRPSDNAIQAADKLLLALGAPT